MKKLMLGTSLAVMLMLLVGGSVLAVDEDLDGDNICSGYCLSTNSPGGYSCH
jgi:hypothetical protein